MEKTADVTGPRVNVTAGRERSLVGSMNLRIGMKTTSGKVTKLYPSGRFMVRDEDGNERRRDNVTNVSITRTEAGRFGYPHADGCSVYPVGSKKKAVSSSW